MISNSLMLIVRVVLASLAIAISVRGQFAIADELNSAIEAAVIETAADDQAAAFRKQVLPLLRTRCITCHGPEKQEGGLRLDSLDAAIKGGDQGSAIVPGDAESSLFVKAITFADPDLQMPPKQKLSDTEISALKQWIQDGAAWPAKFSEASSGEQMGDAFHDEKNPVRQLFGEERLTLWSLQTPTVTQPDGLSDADRQRPSRIIDAIFLLFVKNPLI